MGSELDLTKPIRQRNGLAATYIGPDRDGNAVIQAELMGGRWTRACSWTKPEVEMCFENIPAEKPKLAGFMEVYSTARKQAPSVSVWEAKPEYRHVSYEDEDYWFSIDMAKVPPEAIIMGET